MQWPADTSPLTQDELVERYFMEHRVEVLDLAAFLDRLDRVRGHDDPDDFRVASLREAMGVLIDGEGDRVKRAQMILSDRDTTLLAAPDRKSAQGANDPEG